MADAAPEVLSREGSTRTRLVVLVLAALGVTLAVGWYVDARRSDHEREALAGCARATTETVTEAERSLGALYDYIAPAVDPPRSDEGSSMYLLLSARAPALRPSVAEALSTCRRVALWHHHTRLRRARDAAITLLTAELTRLDEVTADGLAYVGGGRDIARLQDQAQRAWAAVSGRGSAEEPR